MRVTVFEYFKHMQFIPSVGARLEDLRSSELVFQCHRLELQNQVASMPIPSVPKEIDTSFIQ